MLEIKKGGQIAKEGVYLNLSSGDFINISQGSTLPGKGNQRFLKIPKITVLIFGPLLGLLFICSIPVIFLLSCLTLLSPVAVASANLSQNDSEICMGCHSNPDLAKTFKNKEKISVHISERDFKGSVHSFLSCTNCHTDVSIDSHPSDKHSSRKELALSISLSCKMCHTDDQLMSSPAHSSMLTKANAPPCSDCHGSHSIKKIAIWKKTVDESQYCMGCHKHNISIMINNEKISLAVDESKIKESVHRGHRCTDCHIGFSKTSHPIKSYKNKRELSIAISSEACKRCHADKNEKLKDSIHYRMIGIGNLNAPVCSDCHGSHSVSPKSTLEAISGTPCIKCHKGVFEEFKKSAHFNAKIGGIDSAPLCSSCHYAHEIKPTLISESVRTMCMGCHKKAVDTHKKWLPGVEAHFKAVNCMVCHVPDAESRLYLHLTDTTTGKIIPQEKIKELLGNRYEELIASRANGINDRQIWNIYSELKNKGVDVTVAGMLGLNRNGKSHSLATKGSALRDCDSCHNAESGFFKTVVMAVIKPEGKEEMYAVNPDVLKSTISLLPLGQFYALGSTRVVIFDYLGIFMVFAGAMIPIMHITARVLTRKLRK